MHALGFATVNIPVTGSDVAAWAQDFAARHAEALGLPARAEPLEFDTVRTPDEDWVFLVATMEVADVEIDGCDLVLQFDAAATSLRFIGSTLSPVITVSSSDAAVDLHNVRAAVTARLRDEGFLDSDDEVEVIETESITRVAPHDPRKAVSAVSVIMEPLTGNQPLLYHAVVARDSGDLLQLSVVPDLRLEDLDDEGEFAQTAEEFDYQTPIALVDTLTPRAGAMMLRVATTQNLERVHCSATVSYGLEVPAVQAAALTGLRLLGQTDQFDWTASVPGSADGLLGALSASVLQRLLPSTATEKVNSRLFAEIGSAERRRELVVFIHEDVSLDAARASIAAVGDIELGLSMASTHSLLCTCSLSDLVSLAWRDAIRWIEPGGGALEATAVCRNLTFLACNDDDTRCARNICMVEGPPPFPTYLNAIDIQAAPANAPPLIALILDVGKIGSQNRMFSHIRRRIFPAASPGADHTATVFNVMAGRPPDDAPTDMQRLLTGVAPDDFAGARSRQATGGQVRESTQMSDMLDGVLADVAAEGGLTATRFVANMSAANNEKDVRGDYTAVTEVLDRWLFENPIVFCTASGNRACWPDGGAVPDVSPPATSKNAIVVGGVLCREGMFNVVSRQKPEMFEGSQQGTGDGRDKPDVLAFARPIPMPQGSVDFEPFESGTSFAAPAIAALAGLLLRRMGSPAPLPSTIKAIIIAGAVPLDRRGEISHGYADAARSLNYLGSAKKWHEIPLPFSANRSARDTHFFKNFEAPVGGARRLVLAWSDPAGRTTERGKTLVLALDLTIDWSDGSRNIEYEVTDNVVVIDVPEAVPNDGSASLTMGFVRVSTSFLPNQSKPLMISVVGAEEGDRPPAPEIETLTVDGVSVRFPNPRLIRILRGTSSKLEFRGRFIDNITRVSVKGNAVKRGLKRSFSPPTAVSLSVTLSAPFRAKGGAKLILRDRSGEKTKIRLSVVSADPPGVVTALTTEPDPSTAGTPTKVTVTGTDLIPTSEGAKPSVQWGRKKRSGAIKYVTVVSSHVTVLEDRSGFFFTFTPSKKGTYFVRVTGSGWRDKRKFKVSKSPSSS